MSRAVTLLKPSSYVLAVLITAAACGTRGSGDRRAPGARQGAAPVPVAAARVVSRTMPVSVGAVGTVEASSTVDIRAQVAGQLGLAVVGGLLVSQTLTLYVTPVFYIYMERLSERLAARRAPAAAPARVPPESALPSE